MNAQITPEQIQNLLTLDWLILLAVAFRLVGVAVWNKWLKDAPTGEPMTQEQRDEWLVQRRRARRL